MYINIKTSFSNQLRLLSSNDFNVYSVGNKLVFYSEIYGFQVELGYNSNARIKVNFNIFIYYYIFLMLSFTLQASYAK